MTHQGSEGLQGGPGGRQGAPGGARGDEATPDAKMSDKTAKQWLQTMVQSTQSVFWPQRDGIYSFLRHLGPFGCITTALFSENANLWIPAISWHFTLLVSTDQTIEFLDGFLIFLSLPYVGKLRKIKKTSRNCIVWSVETSKVKCIFFRIFGQKIQKNLKNSKKKLMAPQRLKWSANYLYFNI